MSDSKSHLPYRPEIDGLRALAVTPVILFHAGGDWFRGGFVGVDIFLVISGYLITRIILLEQEKRAFSIAAFYERRVRRILPALFFMMLSTVPFAWLWMSPEELKSFGSSLAAVSIFSSNVLFWKTSGYFDASAEEKPLLHTWSLGVEEQYYVVFPLLLIAMHRVRYRHKAVVIAGVTVISLVLAEWGTEISPMASYYLLPTRAWELLLGSLLAVTSCAKPLHQSVGPVLRQSLSILGIALIGGAIALFDDATPIPGLYALFPAFGAALILGFATEGTVVAYVLSSRWIAGLGLISYSAYLWHQPLFAFARLHHSARPSPTLFSVLVLLTMAIAYVSWRFVESPFRRVGKFSRGSMFLMTLVGSVLFFSLGATAYLFEGYPGRLDEQTQLRLRASAPSPLRHRCHTAGRNFTDPINACVYFTGPGTWAILGDSHTVEPAYALAGLLTDQKQAVVHLSFSGCPPSILFESSEPGCSRWQRLALERIEKDRTIGNVLVGFRYSFYLFGDQLATYPALPNQSPNIGNLSAAASRDLIWESFVSIVTRLQASGKRVFVLGPIPELDKPIHKKIVLGQFRGQEFLTRGTSRSYYEQRNDFILSKLRTLHWGSSLVLVDPATTLCNEDTCWATINGIPMYFDDDHLSVAGAAHVLSNIRQYYGPYR